MARINGHTKEELESVCAGDYISNPQAIREHYPIVVYYKKRRYWDYSFIEIFYGETVIWACDGYDDITPEMEIYLSTDPKRIEAYKEKYE